MNNSNTLPAKTGKINGKPAYSLTLEKAGIYRGKQRYTVNEIPDLGATISPEVEAARWLLVRGADPADQMAVSYPKGQGFPLELQFQGKSDIGLMNPHVTTLDNAAHLFRSIHKPSRRTRIVSDADYEANLANLNEFQNELATRRGDKIGAESWKQLKREAGILIEDYPDMWRKAYAAELQEGAAKWEDGRSYWRNYDVWRKTKHLDKTAYGAAMAARLRWEADMVLHRIDIDEAASMAKDYELHILHLPLRAWVQRRIDKGASLIEACRARVEHKVARESAKLAKAKAEKAEREEGLRLAERYLKAEYGLSIPLDAWEFEFKGRRYVIHSKRGLIDQSTKRRAEDIFKEDPKAVGDTLDANENDPDPAALTDQERHALRGGYSPWE